MIPKPQPSTQLVLHATRLKIKFHLAFLHEIETPCAVHMAVFTGIITVTYFFKALGKKVADKVKPWSQASLLAPSSAIHSLGPCQPALQDVGCPKMSF